jgi:hypothetical protein
MGRSAHAHLARMGANFDWEGIVYPKTNPTPMTADMTELAENWQTERDKVTSWRLHVLIEAGYPLSLAERIAQSEADLHRAVELVDQGCNHKTAAEILL